MGISSKPKPMLRCEQCGEEFPKLDKLQKFCCKECMALRNLALGEARRKALENA